MTKIVMENNGAVQKVMIPEFLGLLACYAMLRVQLHGSVA